MLEPPEPKKRGRPPTAKPNTEGQTIVTEQIIPRKKLKIEKPISQDKPISKAKPISQKENTILQPVSKSPSINKQTPIVSIPRNNTPENLIVYNLSHNGVNNSTTESQQEITMLNNFVKVLQQEIINTSHTTNSEQSLYIKDNKLYEGTVRISGLFRCSESNIDKRNLLEEGEVIKGNIAIQAWQGNPNGVLAISLNEANNYLKEYSKVSIDELNKNKEEIDKISSASRKTTGSDESGASASFKNFGDALLKSVYTLIIGSSLKTEEKLIWLTKIYSPFLSKGLSDISQAGELAKYYILRLIEEKKNKGSSEVKIIEGESKYWNTTQGLPYLVAFSSDTIASALGTRIQNQFKGQFQSVLPRKNARGKVSVLYIPYKYIPLMIILSGQSMTGIDGTVVTTAKTDFNISYSEIVKIVLNKPAENYDPIEFGTNQFYMEINNLVDNIYKLYKISKGDIFSESLLKIIQGIQNDSDLLKNLIDFINGKNSNPSEKMRYLIYILNSFNAFAYFLVHTGQNITDAIVYTLEYLKRLLITFGDFIVKLSDFLKKNETVFDNKIKKLIQDSNIDSEFYVPSWTGIVYSSIAYYQNCDYLDSIDTNELSKIYLELSTVEESCAEQDVDYGHDQVIPQIQPMGESIARDWFNKNETNTLRRITKFSSKKSSVASGISELGINTNQGPLVNSVVNPISDKRKATTTSKNKMTDVIEDYEKPKKPGKTNISDEEKSLFNEEDFSKHIINELHFCTMVETYDREGNPILQCKLTKNPKEDYMFNEALPGGIPSSVVNYWQPIGTSSVWSSIDFVRGDPFINVTKYNINNGFKTYEDLINYIGTESIVEIRTPVTDFDAAAPSGCNFKTTEKMCVSYRKFKPIPGSSSSDSSEYMYIILTYNLSDKSKNNLDLDLYECLLKASQRNIFLGDVSPAGLNTNITNKMVDFTTNYQKGNETNNAMKLMWILLDNYYKDPKSKIFTLPESPLQINLLKILENINKSRQNYINKKTQTSWTEFKKESKNGLDEMISKIAEAYQTNKYLDTVYFYVVLLLDSLLSTEPGTTAIIEMPENKIKEDFIKFFSGIKVASEVATRSEGAEALLSLQGSPPKAVEKGVDNFFSRVASKEIEGDFQNYALSNAKDEQIIQEIMKDTGSNYETIKSGTSKAKDFYNFKFCSVPGSPSWDNLNLEDQKKLIKYMMDKALSTQQLSTGGKLWKMVKRKTIKKNRLNQTKKQRNNRIQKNKVIQRIQLRKTKRKLRKHKHRFTRNKK